MKKTLFFFFVIRLAVFSCWATEGYEDLAKLVKSGVSEDVILAFINSSNVGFALTPDNILNLKDMGASNKVITAAIQHKKPVNDSIAQKAVTTTAPSAKTGQPMIAPSGKDDTSIVYESLPPSGRWVFIDNYWYWQYPTGVIIDLGWQPYYYYHNRWFPFRHWGRRGW